VAGKQKGFLTSRSSRFFKLTGLTTRVSSSYTGQRLKEMFLGADRKADARTATHIRNAERIVRTLGELKGAVMKVGQAASIQADLLPKEFGEILATLQHSAPPMEFELIEAQIRSEFGKDPDALFARFDREPFASASVGQVHRARLADGTEVVVKVQYPGVEDNIDGDLKNLKSLIGLGSIIGYRRQDLDETFEEIRDRLVEELDYTREMENLLAFRERFRDDPRVLVPGVFPPYCSRRVLTLEYLPGDPLEALLAPPYTQEDRNRFGRLLFELYLHQVFRLGLLHADPHPGNFAFRRDGRMVFYDFGCLKRIPPHIQEGGRDILRAALRNDYRGIDVALLRLGSRDPRKEAPPPDFYRRYVEVFKELAVPGVPYDFRASRIHERLMELAPLGFSKMLHFKPSRDLIFIGRVIGGHYGNLRHMRASAPWLDLLEPYLEE